MTFEPNYSADPSMIPKFNIVYNVEYLKLKSSLQNVYHDLIDRYGIYVSQMTTDMFHLW